MTTRIRTVVCTIREARQRLNTARAYLEAAELILGDERREFSGVAAGNAVLAGIAAADAICGKGLKKCFRGEDHRQATELLEAAFFDGPKCKKTLLRLLDLKDAAHYGFQDFSRASAQRAVKFARELVDNADVYFQR
ncbi:MAG TPA: hypothetical protein VMU68_15220 [Acidimicrobiales bacterium]|nr:hypothetical protein [Acidimicrobiales bacterium]